MEASKSIIHASSMPRGLACPASLFASGYQMASDEATLGQAVHAGMALVAKGKRYDSDALALAFQCDPRELGMLLGRANAMWNEAVAGYFMPKPEVEYHSHAEQCNVMLTGTVDLAAWCENKTLHIGDWKSGWKDSDYWPQLLTYAWLLSQERPVERIWLGLLWVRPGEVDGQWIDKAALDVWQGRLVDVITRGRAGEYHPGQQCSFCPSATTCPALAEKALALRAPDAPAITTENIFELHSMVKAVEARCAELRAAMRAVVAQNNGVILGKDGKALAFVETQKAETQLNEQGYEFLVKQLGHAETMALLEMGLGKLDKAVGGKAQRGQKGKAIEAARTKLEELGVLTYRPVQELRLVAQTALAEKAKAKEVSNG